MTLRSNKQSTLACGLRSPPLMTGGTDGTPLAGRRSAPAAHMGRHQLSWWKLFKSIAMINLSVLLAPAGALYVIVSYYRHIQLFQILNIYAII